MRSNGFPILIALVAITLPATPCAGATFGTVAAIAGHASDIALDESRGKLYIANYTANCIDVLTLATNSLQSCQLNNGGVQPGSLALSPDSQYLLIAQGPTGDQFPTSSNRLTLIHLADQSTASFSTGTDTPLAVAFFSTVASTGPSNLSGPGLALVVTTSGILTLNPTNGVLTVVSTFANLTGTLPVALPTFPPLILQAALTTSADGLTVWGIAQAGTPDELIYVYSARTGSISTSAIVASPQLLPRISVADNGSYAMVGYALMSAPTPVGAYQGLVLLGRYPSRVATPNVTGSAIDSTNNLVYAQIPDGVEPVIPPYSAPNWPILLMMDADNLTVRDRIMMPESIVGRAILNAAATTLYAISDSGVMVLPVGQLSQNHRLAASVEDVLIQTNFCNRTPATQTFTITDPGGGSTDFSISSSNPGITLSPSSGTTPATIKVLANTSVFTGLGTTAVTLTINSVSAINGPKTVRALVNNPDTNQRGTIVDVPGVLTDILPDTARNRFYILRSDINQVLLFDGNTNQQITSFRTATNPTKFSFTPDGNYLMVGHNDSQLVTMYDLNAMQAVQPILMPFGHFGLSIAQSNAMVGVLARDESTEAGVIESIDLVNHIATPLGTLGIWKNEDATYLPGMLVPSSNGVNILLATGGGKVALYSALQNTFTVGRQDLTSLGGAVATSTMGTYVIGNNIFNASLVPQGLLDTTYGTTAGFSFLPGTTGGYRATATTAAAAGVIQNLPSAGAAVVQPTTMMEAPLLPTTTNPFTRTLAPLPGPGSVIALTTSGFTVLSANYPAATTPPSIAGVTNAANGASAVAQGGLISVYGSSMSATNIATSQIPLPTAMGDSCLTVNGTPIPLMFVSTGQINAQLPLGVSGGATMAIHTPAGISNNFTFTVLSAAPAIFLTGTAGPETGLATVFRADNGQLVTPTNPVHANDTLIIYLTGMGLTAPSVEAGQETPPTLLTSVTQAPLITLGGSNLTVQYAGLAPGYISGLYQVNATVPFGVTQGMDIPLVISQGSSSTTLSLRVVN